MFRRARQLRLWLGLGLCLGWPGPMPAWAQPSDPFPQPAASYLLMLQDEPLWARQPAKPLPPASLTKIMTALLALERGRPDEAAAVSQAAAGETGSRLGLQPGESMRVGDLLAATLLMSANDACRALAEHLAGSEASFVDLMNRRAQALGLGHTSFRNACGHDQEGHRSTARDLARLASTAMAHPAFAALAATVRMTVQTLDGRRSFPLENKNELIGRYPGAIGVKSGFTAQAGKCVIAAVERDGRRVLLVLLNAPDRWWTAVAMLDRAFSQSVSLSQAGASAP